MTTPTDEIERELADLRSGPLTCLTRGIHSELKPCTELFVNHVDWCWACRAVAPVGVYIAKREEGLWRKWCETEIREDVERERDALREQLAARDREVEKLRAVEKAARLLREKVIALFKSYEHSGIPSEDFMECIDNLMQPIGLDTALAAIEREKGET